MVSKSWIKKLFEESKNWVNQGLIDSQQEARIRSFYAGRMEYKRLINTITSLGSILVGLGIILFIASNWQKLSRPAKVTIIFSAITLFHLASFYFRYVKDKFLGLSEGFLIIASFAFGAGIWLIAQIYQIHYNFSAGILFWVLGLLPLVFFYRSWTVLVLSAILSLIWFFSYQAYYFNREIYGLMPLLVVLVALCYYLKQRFSLFIVIFAFSQWIWHFWWLRYFPSEQSVESGVLIPQLFLATAYIFFGFLLYGLGIWHEKLPRYNVFSFLYKFMGVIFISASAYSLTFTHHYHEFLGTAYPSVFTVLIMLLFLIATVFFHKLYKQQQETHSLKEIQYSVVLLILAPICLLISLFWPKATSATYNIILLGQIFVFMYVSFIRHSEGIFRLAIAIFFIDIISRYFDTFWKMMPRSLLFMLGGVILIAGAIFADKARRKIEAQWQQGGAG